MTSAFSEGVVPFLDWVPFIVDIVTFIEASWAIYGSLEYYF